MARKRQSAEEVINKPRRADVDLDEVNTAVVLKYSEKPRLNPIGMSDTLGLKPLEDQASSASLVD